MATTSSNLTIPTERGYYYIAVTKQRTYIATETGRAEVVLTGKPAPMVAFWNGSDWNGLPDPECEVVYWNKAQAI
jgi:hypothetical protein